jgi:DNA-directed RNA polymerase subunit RPC12/RpoP
MHCFPTQRNPIHVCCVQGDVRCNGELSNDLVETCDRHHACSYCLYKYLSKAIHDNRVVNLNCPGCDESLTELTIFVAVDVPKRFFGNGVVVPATWEFYCRLKQLNDGWTECIVPDCQGLFEPGGRFCNVAEHQLCPCRTIRHIQNDTDCLIPHLNAVVQNPNPDIAGAASRFALRVEQGEVATLEERRQWFTTYQTDGVWPGPLSVIREVLLQLHEFIPGLPVPRLPDYDYHEDFAMDGFPSPYNNVSYPNLRGEGTAENVAMPAGIFKCPRCNQGLEKISGCSEVRCPICSHKFRT